MNLNHSIIQFLFSFNFFNIIVVQPCPTSCIESAIHHIEKYNGMKIPYGIFLTTSSYVNKANELYEDLFNSTFSPHSYRNMFIQNIIVQNHSTKISAALTKISSPTVAIIFENEVLEALNETLQNNDIDNDLLSNVIFLVMIETGNRTKEPTGKIIKK